MITNAGYFIFAIVGILVEIWLIRMVWDIRDKCEAVLNILALIFMGLFTYGLLVLAFS